MRAKDSLPSALVMLVLMGSTCQKREGQVVSLACHISVGRKEKQSRKEVKLGDRKGGGAAKPHLRERLEHHAGDLGGIRCSAAC